MSKQAVMGDGRPLPPLPLNPPHWKAIFKAMRLSPQHAKVVDLVLRDLSTKEIAAVMGIAPSTVETYLDRIYLRTGTRSRVQLVVHVLGVSHQVNGEGRRPQR